MLSATHLSPSLALAQEKPLQLILRPPTPLAKAAHSTQSAGDFIGEPKQTKPGEHHTLRYTRVHIDRLTAEIAEGINASDQECALSFSDQSNLRTILGQVKLVSAMLRQDPSHAMCGSVSRYLSTLADKIDAATVQQDTSQKLQAYLRDYNGEAVNRGALLRSLQWNHLVCIAAMIRCSAEDINAFKVHGQFNSPSSDKLEGAVTAFHMQNLHLRKEQMTLQNIQRNMLKRLHDNVNFIAETSHGINPASEIAQSVEITVQHLKRLEKESQHEVSVPLGLESNLQFAMKPLLEARRLSLRQSGILMANTTRYSPQGDRIRDFRDTVDDYLGSAEALIRTSMSDDASSEYIAKKQAEHSFAASELMTLYLRDKPKSERQALIKSVSPEMLRLTGFSEENPIADSLYY